VKRRNFDGVWPTTSVDKDSRPHSKVRVIACKPKARILPRVIAGPANELRINRLLLGRHDGRP
jgi:hypothetical protein